MMFLKALFLCISKHIKQKDKAGKCYIFHPLKVMSRVKGYKCKIVALLHDIVEDTDCTREDLKKYGLTNEIITAIDCLTKNKNLEYQEYIDKIKNCEIARKVKIEDLKHNMDLKRLKIVEDKDRKRVEKYKMALEMLMY